MRVLGVGDLGTDFKKIFSEILAFPVYLLLYFYVASLRKFFE